MPTRDTVQQLLQILPGRFSCELGIRLEGADPQEIFKWFLASLLFGTRIGEKIAANTFRTFAQAGMLTPNRILATGWDGLVELLDQGGYVRYDYKTATKLLEIASRLEEEYQGNLNNLHAKAAESESLENLLQELKGVGPVTANIFLRELRGVWKKANPPLSDLALRAALDLGLLNKKQAEEPGAALTHLKKTWQEANIKGKKFSDFETALVRLGKDYCRKNREKCPLREYHVSANSNFKGSRGQGF